MMPPTGADPTHFIPAPHHWLFPSAGASEQALRFGDVGPHTPDEKVSYNSFLHLSSLIGGAL
jgi:hypothetical protein